MTALTKSQKLTAVIIIICLCIVAQFATDSFLPSFPAIAKSFYVANTSVQLSITFFFLGAVPAQFIFGTLSDTFGRRPLNIIGISVFILGTLLSLFAANIHLFLWGRLIQGFGIGSGFVLAWASARDMFSGKEFAKVISILAAITVLIPVISPVVGGYIQGYLGWRYTFVLLSIMGITLLIAIISVLPETLKIEHKQTLHFHSIYKSYNTLLMSRVFLTNGLCAPFATSAIIIYITITPFLYQSILHLTPVLFSWMTALIAVGVATGCIVNSKFLDSVGSTKLIMIGIATMLIGVLLMITFALLNTLNLYVILFPMLIITLSVGFIIPNTTSRAMEPFDKLAGTASALFSGLQMFILSGASAIASISHTRNQKPLAFLLLILPLIIIFLISLSKQKKTIILT